MGAEQSQPVTSEEKQTPKTVTINRNEIPNAYLNVFVSEDVVRNVAEHSDSTRDNSTTSSSSFIPEQKNNVAQENFNKKAYEEDLNKIFNETVDKVQKQLSTAHESACKENEEVTFYIL